MKKKNWKEVVADQKLKYHHSARARGYIRVRNNGDYYKYAGKYGRGIIVMTANLRSGRVSNRYYDITYYIA